MPKGAVALVVGGARGIGRAISSTLARDGARVAVLYHRGEQAALSLANEVSKEGGEMSPMQVDVRDETLLRRRLAEVEGAWGPVEILVYNSGISKGMPLLGAAIPTMRETFEVNYWAAVIATQTVLREMLRRKQGRIIYISSPSGDRGGLQGQCAYASSKAALNSLARTLAAEVSHRGDITVNSVAPGPIRTALTTAALQEFGEHILAATPAERFGDPEDVAELVAFLASERACYITGQVLYVDGGYSNKYVSRRKRFRRKYGQGKQDTADS